MDVPPPSTVRLIQIQDIDHVVLRAKDLPRMVQFYCDVIGCSVEWDRPDRGLVHLRAGRCMIDLVSVDGPTGQRGGAAPGAEGHNMDHLCLRIKAFDVDTIVKHLEAHGAKVGKISDRFGAEGRGMSIYLQDPEGNTVELKGTKE
jgi:glyoxylase I family protein